MAKYIVPFLGTGLLYEPFVGAFNIVPALSPAECLCSDIHAGLIGLYTAVQQGWEPPERITEQEYRKLQAVCGNDPLSVFASFAASFGGKEWGGYARDATGRRDLTAEGAVAFRKKIPWIKQARFRHSSYVNINPAPRSVIYCDPPYAGTTAYRTGLFNAAEFVSWCNRQTNRGCRVYISEFTNPCPERWHVVWQKERATSLEKGVGRKTELLLQVV